jgi:hypothetical protein
MNTCNFNLYSCRKTLYVIPEIRQNPNVINKHKEVREFGIQNI